VLRLSSIYSYKLTFLETENVNLDKAESDGISSLSGGLSPDRKRFMDANMEGGAEVTAFPVMLPQKPTHSESSTTDDDTRPMLNNPQVKRSWRGRLPSIRKKADSPESIASKSLALQEDSSVSSWSHGSPENNGSALYGNGKAKSSADSMPEEMKAFGEDFGLAAAELAMRQEEEAKEESDDDDDAFSQKSSNSLRDELDRAIESGDWAAVEAQTNKMFDVSMDDLDANEKLAGKKRSDSLASYDDSADDEDSREGWSTNSKSVTTEDSEQIDDERIAMLERLIETDDWQGIVTTSPLHNRDDSSIASSAFGVGGDGLISLATERDEGDVDDDEDLSLAA